MTAPAISAPAKGRLGNGQLRRQVAEPTLGRGGNSGGGHREYLREKRGREIAGGRALRRNRVLIAGEFPPEFPGTQRRYLAFSEAVNAFPPRNSQFPCQFPRIPLLAAPELITVRPHTFPAAPTAFPRLPSPPASHLARLPSPGRTPSRSRAGTGLGARTRGGEYMSVNGYRATDRRPGINVRHASAARHSPLFYKLYAYMSLGVHRKVYYRRVQHVRH
jgi:hypothetical protein